MPSRSRQLLVAVLIAFLVPVLPSAIAQGTPSADQPPCWDGQLRIADLEGAQDSLQPGIDAAQALATEWEDDARLVSLKLGCPLLQSGYRWEGVFFSEAAQAYWNSGTDSIEAANDDPDTIRTLVTDAISLSRLHRSLLRAGFGDDLIINVTNGVTIRYNTVEQGFGPPTAPVNTILFHVAIEERGEIKDVWVSADDGTVYRY